MNENSLLKSRKIKNVNGLDIYIKETNIKTNKDNVIFLLHGFPELSYSYRHLMIMLAKSGYYCVAPDQRGYGKTTSKEKNKVSSFSVLNLTKDIYLLSQKLRIKKFHLIGHDFGSYVSSYFALLYPNKLLSITLMSMPFAGPPDINNIEQLFLLNKSLSFLKPRRKHYQFYFSSRNAAKNIMNCKQGLKSFLRGYFYFKSFDYPFNKPHKLEGYSSNELAKMPEYYIMKYNLGMAETIKKFMPSDKEILNCKWLTDKDILIYVNSFKKKGILEPLNWYKMMLSKREKYRLINMNLNKSINIPAIFISGIADWGTYQKPGELEKMEKVFFTNFYGTKIIKKAGHWVQQENPKETYKEIIKFFKLLIIK